MVTSYGAVNGELEWCSPDRSSRRIEVIGEAIIPLGVTKAWQDLYCTFCCAIIGISGGHALACFLLETTTMVKKHISAYELSWIVLQELRDKFQFPNNVAIAVVPDERRGWRIVLPKSDGRALSASGFTKAITVLEKRLRKRYVLKDE